ncbi:MAG: nucleotidyltransferase family protein [Elusimicrobia bacterium]|nr:nucleotidyltransferase family protein [Elusimicrobiota bacterium]
MSVIILAGGHGECMRLGDDYVPKLMISVGGKPLLEHHIEWLKSAGYDSIVLSVGVKADVVRSHFSDGSQWGVKLRYLVQQTRVGNADTVKALGAASLPDDTLVFLGDVWARFDVVKMLEFHRSHQGLATLALRKPEKDDDAQTVVMGPSRRVVSFPEYPSDDPEAMAAVPVWIIRRQLLHHVPDEGPSSFLKDVFPAVLRAGHELYGFPVEGEALDLGTPERLERLSRRFAKSLAV